MEPDRITVFSCKIVDEMSKKTLQSHIRGSLVAQFMGTFLSKFQFLKHNSRSELHRSWTRERRTPRSRPSRLCFGTKTIKSNGLKCQRIERTVPTHQNFKTVLFLALVYLHARYLKRTHVINSSPREKEFPLPKLNVYKNENIRYRSLKSARVNQCPRCHSSSG